MTWFPRITMSDGDVARDAGRVAAEHDVLARGLPGGC